MANSPALDSSRVSGASWDEDGHPDDEMSAFFRNVSSAGVSIVFLVFFISNSEELGFSF